MNREPKFRKGGIGLLQPPAPVVIETEDGQVTDVTSFLSDRMRFAPRKSEAEILAKIEEAAEKYARDLFADADDALENLYLDVRIPEVEKVKNKTVTMVRDGRVIWKLDEAGSPIEDWSRLDGMDIERAIMTLQRVIGVAVVMVAQLQGRVEFAYAVSQDEYWEAYGKDRFGGTNDQREAAARRTTWESRYYYFYTRAVWTILSAKLDHLKNVKRDLEFMRSRLIKEVDHDQQVRIGRPLRS
jgi:hypothetical protein